MKILMLDSSTYGDDVNIDKYYELGEVKSYSTSTREEALKRVNEYNPEVVIINKRELLSSVINNRLNNVMKILTSITIVMAIPTIISGIYGMNVDGRWMPLSTTPYGFYIIVGIILVICIGVLWFLKKKKMM